MEASPLTEALRRQSLALFVGADLPLSTTGLPSRQDLAALLRQKYGLANDLGLADVAQQISQTANRWELADFLRSALDPHNGSPQPFHFSIAALSQSHSVKTIITAGQDNLLEMAFRQAGVSYNLVISDNDVPFIDGNRTTLIKIFGDIQRPESMVVTEQDHSLLIRNPDKAAVIEEIRQVFRKQTVLFIGYDLSDVGFRFLFDSIATGAFARKAYAVSPGLSEMDVQMWNQRGISTLKGEPLAILDDLAAQCEVVAIQALNAMPAERQIENKLTQLGQVPGQGVTTTPDVYVSYAWGDDETPEGQRREEIVDRMCTILGRSGREVGRDKFRTKAGDSIESFADEIARAPRIIAVIGEKFLRSKFCMVDEIYSAYQRVGFRRREFQTKIIALVMDDAESMLRDDVNIVKFWKGVYERERCELESLDVNRRALERWSKVHKLGEMCDRLLDMLDSIKDIIMPRGFEKIVNGGFQDVIDRLPPKQP